MRGIIFLENDLIYPLIRGKIINLSVSYAGDEFILFIDNCITHVLKHSRHRSRNPRRILAPVLKRADTMFIQATGTAGPTVTDREPLDKQYEDGGKR